MLFLCIQICVKTDVRHCHVSTKCQKYYNQNHKHIKKRLLRSCICHKTSTNVNMTCASTNMMCALRVYNIGVLNDYMYTKNHFTG